jgi:hypothetical protein
MSSAGPRLSSRRIEAVDEQDANEIFQRNGWSDGLPVTAPTPERVQAALAACGLDAGELLGVEPVRGLAIPAEKVAISAVMAGCRPEYTPVVIAAVRAMLAEEYLLHGSSASTGGCAPLLIVNGPVRGAIGLNAGSSALGGIARANATIGRAVRLFLITMLGCIPGEMDKSTLGHPGKTTFCLAEDEEGLPPGWRPLAEERGIPAGASAVTVLAAEAPRQVMNEWTTDPREIVETFAAEIRHNMLTYSIWPGNYAIVIAPQLRDLIAAAGWTKREVREALFDRARVRRADWRAAGKGALVDRGDPEQEYRAFRRPDDALVVCAGGPAGGFGAVIPPWLGNRSLAVTRALD